MGIEEKIANCHLLTDIFGRFPSFHDAEVLSVTLDRRETASFNPTLKAAIHVFEMTSEVDASGKYVLKNHVIVHFLFSRIAHLELEDFNHQNVLQCLDIKHLSDREQDAVRFKVLFQGIYGLEANFHCNSISIETVEPYSKVEAENK